MARRRRERVILLPPLPMVEEEVEDSQYVEPSLEEMRDHLPPSRHTRRGLRRPAVNVDVQLKGNKLILTVDLDQEFGIPPFRKNIRVASTNGQRPVASDNYPYTYYMLSVYRFPPQKQRRRRRGRKG